MAPTECMKDQRKAMFGWAANLVHYIDYAEVIMIHFG